MSWPFYSDAKMAQSVVLLLLLLFLLLCHTFYFHTVLEFYTPCNFSATANARDFKFCTRVGHAKS